MNYDGPWSEKDTVDDIDAPKGKADDDKVKWLRDYTAKSPGAIYVSSFLKRLRDYIKHITMATDKAMW